GGREWGPMNSADVVPRPAKPARQTFRIVTPGWAASLPANRLLEARGACLRAGSVALSADACLQRRHAIRRRGLVAAEAAGVAVVVLQVVHQAARGVARLAEEDHCGAVRLGLLPPAVALGHGGDDDVLHRVAEDVSQLDIAPADGLAPDDAERLGEVALLD